MKQSMHRDETWRKGYKDGSSGRLGGADIARTEHYHDGTIPFKTLRADIDYGFATANTTYGAIGVNVGYTRASCSAGPRGSPRGSKKKE